DAGLDGGVWDLRTGKQVLVLEKRFGPALFSPDGRYLAVGTRKGWVEILLVPTGNVVRHFYSAPGWLALAGAFSPDGKKLATIFKGPGGDERDASGYVKVWDFRSGTEELMLHRTANSAAFSPDGQELAIGSSDAIVRLDANKGHEIGSYRGNFSRETR